MSYLIKEMNIEERPRERFKKFGVEALSNEELLSILMRTGTKSKSVKQLSFDLLKELKMKDLAKISYQSLKNIKGIGEVKAITILSAIEFGKRVLSKSGDVYHIQTGDDVFNLCRDELSYEIQEKFLVVYLDTRKNVIEKKIIFVGSTNSSNVTPKDVFREGVRCNAVSMILVHNHPAGSINPSKSDIELTSEFIKLGKMMGITITDHIIIAQDKFLSIRMINPQLFIDI